MIFDLRPCIKLIFWKIMPKLIFENWDVTDFCTKLLIKKHKHKKLYLFLTKTFMWVQNYTKAATSKYSSRASTSSYPSTPRLLSLVQKSTKSWTWLVFAPKGLINQVLRAFQTINIRRTCLIFARIDQGCFKLYTQWKTAILAGFWTKIFNCH